VSGSTRTCTTLLMVYMHLDQLLRSVVLVVLDRVLMVGLPGVFLVMLTMDSVHVTLGLKDMTDHVLPIVVTVILG
jgi:hypothetical protein